MTYDVLASGPGPLRAPGRPGALEDLFLLTDGFRVACRLTIAYPGVGADLRWASESLVGIETTALDAVDAVLTLGLRPEPDRRDVTTHPRARGPRAASLRSSSIRATAADALRGRAAPRALPRRSRRTTACC